MGRRARVSKWGDIVHSWSVKDKLKIWPGVSELLKVHFSHQHGAQ